MSIKTPELDIREDFQKNHIINGNFDFWQRGTSFTDLGDRYTADRWFRFKQTGLNPGVSTSRQTITDLPGSQYCARIQRTSGSTAINDQELVYVAETKDSVPLAGKVMTLSFYARKGANFSATSSTLKINRTYGTGTDQGVLAGFTNQVIQQDTFQLTTSWTKYTVTYPAFSNTMSQWRFEFLFTPTGTAGAADYFEIAQVMFNEGIEAFAFSRAGKNIAEELILCQRYYEKSYDLDTVPGTATQVGCHQFLVTAGNTQNTVYMKTTKRTNPTVNIYSIGTGTAGQWRNISTSADTPGGAEGIGASVFGVFHTNILTGGNILRAHWIADAEL